MKGLNNEQVLQSRAENGSNVLTQVERDPLWKQLLEGFKDPMLIILLVAFAIQLIFVFMGRAEGYEAVGILVAVLIANLVGVLSENTQEGKAAALRAEEQAKEKTKVIRDDVLIEIPTNDVVVGDIVVLQAGDKIPADGILVEGQIKVDQAALNGESEEAKKNTIAEDERDAYIADNEIGTDLMSEYYVFRGTVVCDGTAKMKVLVVGDKSTYGKLALEMQEDTRETPLKVKLNKLAGQISKFGYIGAIAIAVIFLIRQLITPGCVPTDFIGWVTLLIDAVSLGVVIVCMAVPEGLPMMISMVLAMNMGKMMKDNVLVHKLNGIETAGSLNILFSDKTGTITKGKLEVVEVATFSKSKDIVKYSDLKDIPVSLQSKYVIGTGVNNSATISGEDIIGGNSTDRALMKFLYDAQPEGIDKSEVYAFNAFDSTKKCSSVVIEKDNKRVTYIKGAAEKIIARCDKVFDAEGNAVKLSNTLLVKLEDYQKEQASRSMRILAVAYSEEEDVDSNELTLVALICIRDDVRPEAVAAIKEVNKAGVQVVMVTGDRFETAVAIAKEAGLYNEDSDDKAITSAELAELSDGEVKEMLPKLKVVARALPTDKSRLVRIAQELDLVAGMTGDGVNDSPALKKADVGFAMGSGTEVAKEAGDITILDDNFLSIEKAILYGRTIMINIRKFLIFQLSVNVTTVALSFFAPLLGIAQPFSIITILYINLVMDTLAAIAFGCEPALRKYMNEAPIKRSESIITRWMAEQIGTLGVYVTVVGLLILLCEPVQKLFYPVTPNTTYVESALLAFFMMTVILNGFCARSRDYNVLEHIGDNKAFIFVMTAVMLLLVVLIHILGPVAGLEPLTFRTWLVMFGFALIIVPLDLIRKAVTTK